MKILTKSIHERLIANGQMRHRCDEQGAPDPDFAPAVKLFTPDAGCTWLLSELLPDDPDIAFGLCDLGLGYPELGYVRLTEIAALRGKLGLPVECDRRFEANYPLAVYAHAAHRAECIVEDPASLKRADDELREMRLAAEGAS